MRTTINESNFGDSTATTTGDLVIVVWCSCGQEREAPEEKLASPLHYGERERESVDLPRESSRNNNNNDTYPIECAALKTNLETPLCVFLIMAALNRPTQATYETHETVQVDTVGTLLLCACACVVSFYKVSPLPAGLAQLLHLFFFSHMCSLSLLCWKY